MNEIAKSAPNGLFTTLAELATLTKLSDQSFTTMVRDVSGKLFEHQGLFLKQIKSVYKLHLLKL